METRTLGERGQVVIPKKIRDFLGLEPGNRIIFENDGENIILKSDSSTKVMEELMKNSKRLKRHITMEEIKKIREESYDLS
jgi:AbrB family looped-hinge helix DNA binding protein